MSKNDTVFVTTPIYYVNGLPHIGHFYCNLLADTFIRFAVLNNQSVKILTGTDEHGQKVQRSAQAANLNVMSFCNTMSEHFKRMSVDFNFAFSYDDFDAHGNFNKPQEVQELYNNGSKLLFNNGLNFIRTTEGREIENGLITESSFNNGRHIKEVQKIWQILYNNGWIYKSKYSGWYAIRDEAFYDDSELVNGKAPTGADVEWQEEESYFFKLSSFQSLLLKLYESNNIIIPHNKMNEILSFLQHNQLHDLSISRVKKKDINGIEFDWGIPIPNDNNHVMYVWLDALFNYISALGGTDSDNYLKYWQNATICHFLGKEITRFHAIYWPAFLLALKYLPSNLDDIDVKSSNVLKLLPDKLYVHGWWTNNGEKISKSLNNVIDPYQEVDWIVSFSDEKISKKIAIDYLRYFCLAIIPFGNDLDYSREKLINVINSELVNNVANLMFRTLSLFNANFDNIKNDSSFNIKNHIEKANLLSFMDQFHWHTIKSLSQEASFYQIIQFINHVANICNQEFDKRKPWKLIKDEETKQEALSLLLAIMEISLKIAIVLKTITPNIAETMLYNLGCSNIYLILSDLDNYNLRLNNIPQKLEIICYRL